MIWVSSLLSFHHCVNTLENTRSITILATILVSSVLISFILSDPDGKKKKRKLARGNLENFKGPRALPVVGNMVHLWFPPSNDFFSWLQNVSQKCGDVIRFSGVFGNPKVIINSHEIATQILSDPTFLLKSHEFETLNSVIGHSVGTVAPEAHPIRRKLLEPGFSGQWTEKSLEIICRHARKYRDSLIKLADNGAVFDVMDHSELHACKIICEIAMGHEVVQDLWHMEHQELILAWRTVLLHTTNRSFHSWPKYDLFYNRSPEAKQLNQCLDEINQFSKRGVFKRRQRWEYLKANCFREIDPAALQQKAPPKPECFLDLLLELEDQRLLTKDQVVHELTNYIISGYSKTGTALSWILHLLSSHPQIQEKCIHELIQVLLPPEEEPRPGSSSSCMNPPPKTGPSFETFTTEFSLYWASSDLAITVPQLKNLNYLEMCIKEALRLYPVSPLLLRKSNKDIQLSDGRVIPSGVDAPINIYSIHRNSTNITDEPNEFKPERHLKPCNMLPFGAGPRTCPGMGLAMDQLKVILAHLLLAFKWESKEENCEKKVAFRGLLVPDNGINVKISRRQ